MDEHAALIDRIKNRDAEALAEYVEAERPRLLRFTRSLMSDKLVSVVEPDDLV